MRHYAARIGEIGLCKNYSGEVRMKARLPFVVSCVAAGCALAWVQEALGDTYRWTGDSGADLNMSTPGNWYNETAGIDDDGPTPEGSDTDVLVFGAVPAGAAFPCLDGDRRLNALVFESDAPSYMINGTVAEDTSNKHMLIFGGENPCIIQNSDAVQTFKNNRPIQFRLDKDLVIYGTGTGGGHLDKDTTSIPR